jgi:hypothetical protein
MHIVGYAQANEDVLAPVGIPEPGTPQRALMLEYMDEPYNLPQHAAAWAASEERRGLDKLHAATLDGLLDKQDDRGADAYLKTYGREMEQDTINLYARHVENASVYGDAYRYALDAFDEFEPPRGANADGPTLTKQRRAAKAKAREDFSDDPRRLKEAHAQIDRLYDEEAANNRQERDEIINVLSEKVNEANGNLSAAASSPLYGDLDSEGQKTVQLRAQQYSAGGVRPEEALREFFRLKDIARENPGKFADMPPFESYGIFSPSEAKYLEALRGNGGVTTADVEGFGSAEKRLDQLLKEYSAAYAPDDKDAEDLRMRREYRAALERVYQQAVADKVAAGGTSLSLNGRELEDALAPYLSSVVLKEVEDRQDKHGRLDEDFLWFGGELQALFWGIDEPLSEAVLERAYETWEEYRDGGGSLPSFFGTTLNQLLYEEFGVAIGEGPDFVGPPAPRSAMMRISREARDRTLRSVPGPSGEEARRSYRRYQDMLRALGVTPGVVEEPEGRIEDPVEQLQRSVDTRGGR